MPFNADSCSETCAYDITAGSPFKGSRGGVDILSVAHPQYQYLIGRLFVIAKNADPRKASLYVIMLLAERVSPSRKFGPQRLEQLLNHNEVRVPIIDVV